MAIKAYDRMRVDNLKPNLREFVQYFSDTVSYKYPYNNFD